MTSRERVRCSLRHKEPDRVPIDLGGHRSSGIAAIACAAQQVHNILADVQAENIIAMLETVRESHG